MQKGGKIMVEPKFFKDYKHNYLILKCNEPGAGENYQSRMLASGKIDRVLKCSVRHINGEAYFYYDISSRVTLENLYRGKKMSYEQVKDFFRQMDIIYRTLGDFFMEEAGLHQPVGTGRKILRDGDTILTEGAGLQDGLRLEG